MSVADALDRFKHVTEMLRTHLAGAVPARMHEMVAADYSAEYLTEHAHRCGARLAFRGTALMFPEPPYVDADGVEQPGTAQLLTDLTDGIAITALLADGGITWLGLHFCPRTLYAEGDCARCDLDAEATAGRTDAS